MSNPSIHELVRLDLLARAQVGLAEYGTTLNAFNGRSAILDAYEEALDLACYLRQVIEEMTVGTGADRDPSYAQRAREIPLPVPPAHSLEPHHAAARQRADDEQIPCRCIRGIPDDVVPEYGA